MTDNLVVADVASWRRKMESPSDFDLSFKVGGIGLYPRDL